MSEVVEFYRVISESEVRATYVNLTDELGEKYGGHFPSHKSKLTIKDGQNRSIIGPVVRGV